MNDELLGCGRTWVINNYILKCGGKTQDGLSKIYCTNCTRILTKDHFQEAPAMPGLLSQVPMGVEKRKLAMLKAKVSDTHQQAVTAAYEYFCACDIGAERNRAHDFYQRLLYAPRGL